MSGGSRRARRRAFGLLSLSGIFLVCILASLFLGLRIGGQKAAIAHLEDQIGYLESGVIPLRFMILSRSEESISARFRFYDADGSEVRSFERSWRGSELFIDSVVVSLGKGHLVFPSKVFTNATAPRGGTELFPYYDSDGFPSIYGHTGLDKKGRATFSDLFGKVKRLERNPEESKDAEGLSGVYGNAVHDLRQLGGFEVGAVYALVVRPTGGIELIRE